MNSLNNKSIKIIALLGIVILSLSFYKIFKDQKNLNTNPDIIKTPGNEEKKTDLLVEEAVKSQLARMSTGKEDMIEGTGNGTTADHWKVLGITNANILSTEEKKLYLMVVESTKAQLEYYSTKKEESLEKVKNLYLPDVFIRYKEYAKRKVSERGVESGGQSYNRIKTIKFSKPRVYEGLYNRIGIINDIKFAGSNIEELGQIFIFKNNNGEWKIEKQREIYFLLSDTETALVQEIKNGE